MTPARFNKCLELLHWDTEVLANILGCNASLTKAWSRGLDAVPPSLAEWLDTLAQVHELAESGMPTNLKDKCHAGQV